MPVDSEMFQQVVAPSVLVPACGLLLMSSTARLNTVLARIRAFHSERLDVWLSNPEPGTASDRVRNLRLEGLEHQSHRLIQRASLLRTSMLLLLLAIAFNLISALALVAHHLLGVTSLFGTVSSACFASGLVLMTSAILVALLEVWKILETVLYEHERVERLCATDPCEITTRIGPDPQKGEGMGL